ncbi:MAG: hypothetical protein KC910_16615 [Candidatus Eremiobacteraeota bacterium]|nr:hypothetical protein [Candidatus Eremiobacteraeota bacterium]
MNRRRGWTIIEAVVGLGLAAVVMVVVSQVLLSTSRLTQKQTQESLAAARLQAVMHQAEELLFNASSAGVTFYRSTSPDGGLLAVHPFEAGAFSGDPRWQDHWECLAWDASSGRLYTTWNPSGAAAAPTQNEVQAMTAPECDQVLQAVLAGPSLVNGHLLAEQVSEFRVSLEPGPLFRVEVELEVPANEHQNGPSREHLRAVKLIHPRNHR